MFNKTVQQTHLQVFKIAQFCIVSRDLHIGRLILKVTTEKNVHKGKLAKAIGRSRGALYSMFDNPTIDASMLIKLCRELDHNFFQDIANVVDQYVLSGKKEINLDKVKTEIEASLDGVPDEEIEKKFMEFIESRYSQDFKNFLRVIRNENDKNVSSDENEGDVSST